MKNSGKSTGNCFAVRFAPGSKALAWLVSVFCVLALLEGLPLAAQQAAPASSATTQDANAPAAQAPAPAAMPVAAPDASQAPAPAAAPASTQTTQPAPDASQTQQAPAENTTAAAQAAPEATSSAPEPAGGITEEELKQLLVGKELYLRGGYLDNNLEFGETGQLVSHSAQGSYTLSGVVIDKVHLTKHKVELEGARYGLHFLGALPYEDPTKAVDRVRITPKKKVLRITIDRELVVIPKKHKEPKEKTKGAAKNAAPGGATPAAQSEAAATAPAAAPTETAAPATPAAPTAEAAKAADASTPESADAEQAKAEMAAAPAAERPADPKSITTTTSPAHAAKLLRDALNVIFAQGLDDKMMAAMPDFWKLYYQAVAAKTDYRPKDASILRQSSVDRKAVLMTKFEPQSNEFAQANGIAGMSLYHAVIGPDGKAAEVSVARPIGFGLDESAVDAIRKASFQPAIKDGKPVSVLLDLVVQFRIYSKRTAVTGKPAEAPSGPELPGPYTLQEQEQKQKSQ